MNPNSPDIDQILKLLNKNGKRSRNNSIVFSSEDIMKDLKLICLDKMEDVFHGTKMSARETTKLLNELEQSIMVLKLALESDEELTVAIGDVAKSSMLALFTQYLHLIVDMKDAIKKQGRKFNVSEYIKEQKQKLSTKPTPSKKRKLKKDESDDYESDSDDGTSDEEEDDDEDDEEEDSV